MHLNLIELFTKSRDVAIPLLICSVIALAILLERIYALNRYRQIEKGAFAVLQTLLERGEPFQSSDPTLQGAPIMQVMETIAPLKNTTEESIWQAAETSVAQQRLRFRRYLNTLATIASISPFIGLFGTVLGVMHSFGTMTVGGLNSQKITGDISEALSATALGLLVAIPSLIAYNFLLGQIQGMLADLQSHAARLIPLLPRTPSRWRSEA